MRFFKPRTLTIGPLEPRLDLWVAWVVSKVSRKLDKIILNIRWELEPIKIQQLTNSTRGDLIEMALSETRSGNQVLNAERIVRRSNQEIFGIGVYWKYLRDSLEFSGMIPLGEDPRTFVFGSKLWIYYQVWDKKKSAGVTYIFCPENKITLRLIFKGKKAGKNAVPFVYENRLYFIYSIDPLSIYLAQDFDKIVKNELKLSEFDLESFETFGIQSQYKDSNGIGIIRGGTSLIDIAGGIFIGFTHTNPGGKYEKSHQIGCIMIDFHGRKVIHKYLTKQKINLLAVPYGISMTEMNEISVTFNTSIGSIHNVLQPIVNLTAIFSTDALLNYIKS